MRQIMDVSGAVLHSEREYEIAPATSVVIGQVVKLAEGMVVPAVAGETGAILGYAAENHTGTADAMNGRNNGTRLLVQDAPGAIAESPAPEVAASGGTATTITVADMPAFAANAFKGGMVRDMVTGYVRRITASAVAAGVLTLTVESGDVPTAGSKFQVFPPMGFVGGNLDGEGRKLVLSATAVLSLQVMGRDTGRGAVWTMATKHALGVGR